MPRGGGTSSPFLDHHVFTYFLDFKGLQLAFIGLLLWIKD